MNEKSIFKDGANKNLTHPENQKGITLIALVITIIVLLILAGVSIAMLTGNNGILTQANKAKVEECHGTVEEGVVLAYGDYKIERETANESTDKTFIDFLLTDKGMINENGVIITEQLIGEQLALGNGSGESDVYKIVKDETSYKLYYYNVKGESLELKVITEEIVDEEETYINITKIIDENEEEYEYEEGSSIEVDIAEVSRISILVETNSKEDLVWTSSDEDYATVTGAGEKNTTGNVELSIEGIIKITVKSGECIKEIELDVVNSMEDELPF